MRAAATLTAIALEGIYLLTDPSIFSAHEPALEAWRELRAAHQVAGAQDIEPEAVIAMLTGIHSCQQIDVSQGRQRPASRSQSRFAEIRGKYAFVPTSVDEFLKRKRENLELENRQ